MRKKRTPIMLVIALTLILSMVLAANAASKCPYGTRDAKCVNWTNPVQDHAYSYITRNTDLPVDNFLYVSMCVQYQEGNNFYLHKFRVLDMSKQSHRQRLIDTFINRIYLYDDKLIITFNHKDGAETITLNDIETALAEQEDGSDLVSSAVPKSRSSPKGTTCFLIVSEGTRTIQCGSPVDCRQTPAGRRLLLNVPSPFWRTKNPAGLAGSD